MFIFTTQILIAQDITLEQARLQYCGKYCKLHQKSEARIAKRNSLPPLPPGKGYKKERFLKMFDIPTAQRLAMYPFSEYDSIYVCIPNLLRNEGEEPRNYLEPRFLGIKQLLTAPEKEHLSDILFNYYFIKYEHEWLRRYQYNCECLYDEYPFLIFIFSKNGKNERFLAFYPESYLFNFQETEFAQLDWSLHKQKKVRGMFEKLIQQHQPTPCKTEKPPAPQRILPSKD